MLEALQFEFMRNALWAGMLASVACGIIGTLVVVNRIVFISGECGCHGSQHVFPVRRPSALLSFPGHGGGHGDCPLRMLLRYHHRSLWALGMAVGITP